MRHERLSELIRLALRMQGSAEGISLADIQTDSGVSRSTAERMRNALRAAVPQIEELGEPGGVLRWRLPPGTLGDLSQPAADEIAALHRAAAVQERDGDTESATRVAALGDKLRAALPRAARTRLEPDIAALLEADGVAYRPGPTLLLKSADGRGSPFPGRTCPTASVPGMPSAV